MTDASPARPLPNPGWGPLSALPGNPLMWVLILSEVVVFTAFFALYAWQRAGDVAGFNAAQQNLDPLMGGLNTLVLLTSGLCVALAVEAISAGGHGSGWRRAWGSGCCSASSSSSNTRASSPPALPPRRTCSSATTTA